MSGEQQSYSLSEAQLEFAKSIFNSIWGLLDKEDRSPEEDLEMLLAAYASLYHWTKVGTAVHYQRGAWMISRVYQTLGKAEPSLEWAQRCQQISEEHASEMEDFDLAFAQEALARAYALSGDKEKALTHWHKAADLGDQIKAQEDKKIFLGDFQGGNWYQLQIR
jgi:tetratricopeptide (TPR) repeat protein